ncbi:hypothetical protein D3C75_547730 [compost metagenome]
MSGYFFQRFLISSTIRLAARVKYMSTMGLISVCPSPILRMVNSLLFTRWASLERLGKR